MYQITTLYTLNIYSFANFTSIKLGKERNRQEIKKSQDNEARSTDCMCICVCVQMNIFKTMILNLSKPHFSFLKVEITAPTSQDCHED